MGLHHLKIPVGRLDESPQLYRALLSLEVVATFPDAEGVVRGVAGTVPGHTRVIKAAMGHVVATDDPDGTHVVFYGA